jgi:hypothetical protein
MGYNIEVSFSVDKNSSVTEMQDNIKTLATNCGCSSFYEDYEIENFAKHKRNHIIIVLNFNDERINNIIKFLEDIKNMRSYHIEVIYDDYSNKIIYASKYYTTQQMNKPSFISFKEEKKQRSYSEDHIKIIETIETIKKHK